MTNKCGSCGARICKGPPLCACRDACAAGYGFQNHIQGDDRVFYVWIDRPYCDPKKPRTKPRRRHQTLSSAMAEAQRLANKTGEKVVVLKVKGEAVPVVGSETKPLSEASGAFRSAAQKKSSSSSEGDPTP